MTDQATPLVILNHMRVGELATGEMVIVDVVSNGDGLIQRAPEPPHEYCWATMDWQGQFVAVEDDRDASWGFSSRESSARDRSRDYYGEHDRRSLAVAYRGAKILIERLRELAEKEPQT